MLREPRNATGATGYYGSHGILRESRDATGETHHGNSPPARTQNSTEYILFCLSTARDMAGIIQRTFGDCDLDARYKMPGTN